MKELFSKFDNLRDLKRDIKIYFDKTKGSLKISSTASKIDMIKIDGAQEVAAREKAATLIQQTFRNKKIKEAILTNPYFSYLSMIDSEDEQFQLSAIMFGRHVAELRIGARERIDNPLINTREYYHRSQNLQNEAIDAFFREFEIPPILDAENYTYMAITRLKNSRAEEDIISYFNNHVEKGDKKDLVLFEKEPYSIAVLAIPKDDPVYVAHVKDRIRHFGLVASSWEIAENVRFTKLGEQLLAELKDKPKIKLDLNLPVTKNELINSEIFFKLNRITSSSGRYATKKLAICLKKMIEGLPELSEGAIKRIALMLDMTNRFYEHHYPRYAFCVYAIVHEISLALLRNKGKDFLDVEYSEFLKESRSTLNKTLKLDEEKLSKSTFVALSSTSGVNSYAIAMRIAAVMKTPDGSPPTVHMVAPCYYELPSISSLKEATPADDADIFMISAGPIVNMEGLTPGVDINRFVKNHIIDTKRQKPTTIIIDATTSLYKNLKLNPDVRKLVEEGKLSIIVHESHQKFGLIHTDEAQYGRVFGWCSKKQFGELDTFKKNAREDFDNHVDIRIGAFISTRCREILEDIKKQHFTNGGILRSILSETKLVTMDVVRHEDMLSDLDELYFLDSPELRPGYFISELEQAAYGVIDYRASFGHYAATTSGVPGVPGVRGVPNHRRLSPDASDSIDCLVAASHTRLSADKKPITMLSNLIALARKKENLSLEEQIVTMGLLHSTIFNIRLFPLNIDEVHLTILTDNVNNNNIIMDDLKNKVVNPKNKRKGAVSLIRMSDNTIALGYCSFDNQYRQINIEDKDIIALGLQGDQSGKIDGDKALKAIKAHINKLQGAAIPKNANLAVVYAAMSNALDCCPLLKNRQHMFNIKAWLLQVREKLIKEYDIQEQLITECDADGDIAKIYDRKGKVDFFDTIRAMYSMNISLKDSELKIISKNPVLCKYIKTSQDKYTIEALIALFIIPNFSSTIDLSLVKDNPDFKAAITKVYKANDEILLSLRKSSAKFNEASISSKVYLSACSFALYSYYSKSNPLETDKVELLTKLKSAEINYLVVLAKETLFAKIARGILMSVTTFIATILVVPLVIHYQNTGRVMFFGAPSAQLKLQDMHYKLDAEIKNNVNSPGTSSLAPGTSS